MCAALRYFYRVIFDFEYQTILFIDSDAPPARFVTFQRFRLAYAIIAVPVYVLQQIVYLPQRFFVLRLPIKIAFKGTITKYLVYLRISPILPP